MAKKINKAGNKFNLSIKHFGRCVDDLTNMRANFRVSNDGSSSMVEWGDTKWRFVDYGNVQGKGFHICKYVRDDAKKFIDKINSGELPKLDKVENCDLEIQKGNMAGLLKHRGNQIYCVDVNDCYWDTLYKMGVTTSDTYLRGLKNKDWKTGRNASVGALSKITVVTEYLNGVRGKSEVIDADENMALIRSNVVYRVHNMFLSLLRTMGDDWIMYFTDCVYVPLNKVGVVMDYFKALGYGTKMSTYELDTVDEKTGKVLWHDYQKNRAKHFQFSPRQLTLNRANFVEGLVLSANKLKENNAFLNEK